ncbi:MAG: hypothetical protein WC565_06185 [Parcubacteria group bacterium]
MGIVELMLFLMLLAKKGAGHVFTPAATPAATPPPSPGPWPTPTPTPTPAKPPAAAPAAAAVKPAASPAAAVKPSAPVVPWPVASFAKAPGGKVVPVPTFEVGPLPPFPAGWEADTPPGKAVIARAGQLLKELWKGGKAGVKQQEQTEGRWITYMGVMHGKKKAVVAYRIKGQKRAA